MRPKRENMTSTKIILYYSPRCGHCKNFRTTWDSYKSKNGNKYEFTEINCEDNNCENVPGYPTVRVTMNNNTKQQSGEMSYNQLDTFIHSI